LPHTDHEPLQTERAHQRVDKKGPSRLRTWLGKLLLILVSVFIGALMAEIALRVVGFSYEEFYQPHPALGYTLRPGKEGWYRKEGQSYVRINSEGLRDREHAKAKPAGTFRIAVLGDSYSEALQVAMEESYWSLLEKKLPECGAFGGRKIEIINFGVSGYGTGLELLTLRERVWDYSPDLVMLQITTNNDLSDNVRSLKKTDRVPYFIHQDGKVVLDDSFKRRRTFKWGQTEVARLGRWFEDHSRLVQAIEKGHRGFKEWLASRRAPAVAAQITMASASAAPTGSELGVDNLVYGEPRDAVWEDAWRLTEDLIVIMNGEGRGRGARFLFVTVSNGIQVYPDAEVRQSFLKGIGGSDLLYPDQRFGALGEREGIPVITLAPQLQVYADQNKVFLHGFGGEMGKGHWNPLGHRVASELIAKELCAGVVK
jgi:hypothetical protein